MIDIIYDKMIIGDLFLISTHKYESKSLKWGPYPFKFDNRCLSNKDLAHSIQNKWETVEKVGHPGFAIMKDLKELASMCRLWNAQVFKKELNKAKDIEK
ncbi:unnamed protein product [Citrullus colocynthis]|uniref:Uncharacterized protein n=1 Tax=Citrullus colocynthis TaxID=252529 RepID=A0ABP0ZE53_9ROSI